MRNILCNISRSIPILVAKDLVRRRNLDYAKNLQAKYFTGESTVEVNTQIDIGNNHCNPHTRVH